MNFLLWVLVILQISYGTGTCRPFWIIGHMANGKDEVLSMLDKGANAIEFDVEFEKDGNAVRIHHGFPCECFRDCTKQTPIDEYFEYLGQVGGNKSSELYRKQFTLYRVDLKLSNLIANVIPTSNVDLRAAGKSVAKKLMQFYWKNDVELLPYVLLGVQNVGQKDFITSFLKQIKNSGRLTELESRFAFEFSKSNDVTTIVQTLEELKLHRIWLADGATNCAFSIRLSIFGTDRLKEVLKMRDTQKRVDKVYVWNADNKNDINAMLQYNVDGIQTNRPEKVKEVLDRPEYAQKYCLATRSDDPWLLIQAV